ncbi:MAG TPA: Maf family nucleotide pyrophosphatase [Burkholderiales bacterium]|nr:Maf family nucleotide pyrophosphatase [Burkholderiales bacterium]
MAPHPLVLASTSPYRRELLARLRVPFEIRAPGIDEVALPGEAPRDTAVRLSQWKAKAAAASCEGALVIGSDQVAVLDGKAIGKPGSHEMAVLQLKTLRGRCVTFHTAVALLNTTNEAMQLAEVPTQVYFRNCSDDEIEHYLALERPYDCTGSARIEGLGVALVERIVSDDPSALIGLPLMQLVTMLRHEGVRIL